MIPKNNVLLGKRSARRPPNQYPTLSAASTTLITLDTLYMVFPKYGANTRVATISRISTHAPVKKHYCRQPSHPQKSHIFSCYYG